MKVWDVDWDAKTHTEFRTLKGHRGLRLEGGLQPRRPLPGLRELGLDRQGLGPEGARDRLSRSRCAATPALSTGLAFSPDGRRLASGSGYAGHGEVKVWDATLWENKSSGGR